MSLYNPSADAPRPKTMRYVFRCPGCDTVYQFEEEELETVGADLLRREHTCTECGAGALVTVTVPRHELKVERIAAPKAPT